MRIYAPETAGVVIHEREPGKAAHWTAFRCVDDIIWFLDSNAPAAVPTTYDDYLGAIARHRAFAVVATND